MVNAATPYGAKRPARRKPAHCVEQHHTPSQVAERLEVCTMTIYRKIRKGEFGDNVVDVGSGDYRIPASAVNAYLERRKLKQE